MSWFLVLFYIQGGGIVIPTPYPNEQACHVAFASSARDKPLVDNRLYHMCVPDQR